MVTGKCSLTMLIPSQHLLLLNLCFIFCTSVETIKLALKVPVSNLTDIPGSGFVGICLLAPVFHFHIEILAYHRFSCVLSCRASITCLSSDRFSQNSPSLLITVSTGREINGSAFSLYQISARFKKES